MEDSSEPCWRRAPLAAVTGPLAAVGSQLSEDEIAALEAPYEAQAVIGALGPEAAEPRDIRASSEARA